MSEIVSGSSDVTVMDMEASIEHMSRGTVRHVDRLLVILEPYYRSMETAGRIVPLARGLGIERISAVANKIRSPNDEEAVKTYCRNHDLEVIATLPFDESVLEADRTGRALIDYDVTSPVVAGVSQVADVIQQEISASRGTYGGS